MTAFRWIPALFFCVACSGSGEREGLTDGGTYYLYWNAIPNEIPFNEPFKLSVMIHDGKDRDYMYTDKQLYVDATMPAHQHGMDTTPEISQNGGLFVVEGMLFHMAGEWALEFAVSDDETVEKATFDIDCCES